MRRSRVKPPSFFETSHPLLVSTIVILGLAAASLGVRLLIARGDALM